MKTTRRNFLQFGLFLTSDFFLGENKVFASQEKLEQKLKINLPDYSLNLMNFVDGKLKETFSFPVGIGKGYDGRKQTPIGTGFIDEKRKTVVFRYGKDNPELNIHKGDIIKWTNTYDDDDNPTGYKMPYSQMRGLGMQIRTNFSNYYYNDFVIHSTTDEFTIGTPASGGCLRVGIKEMLRLYDLVSPETKQGTLENPIPIKTSYDLVELNNEKVKLHANIYNKKIDPVQELKKKITNKFNPEDFDFNKIQQEFTSANEQFIIAHKQILTLLSKSFPNNFVPSSLKEKLHKTYDISSFLRG